MSNWQPIETAPKDGTEIDVWVAHEDGTGYRSVYMYWIDDSYGEGYWYGPRYRDGQPTHWMPIPQPPERDE